jgi:hypothetical protein
VLVLGRVVHAAIDAGVLDDVGPNIEQLRPLSRLGRNQWGLTSEIRQINRIPYASWPGHFDASSGG